MSSTWSVTAKIRELDSHDRNRVALRRGLRTAIATPIAVVILTSIPAFQETALFGVFAVIALLVFADFGGSLKARLIAYLATVAAGVPIMIVGSLLGTSIAAAAAMMAVITLIIGVLAVLRGFVASSQTTLLLVTVLAVTSTPPGSTWTGVGAWLVGGLIATVAALVLWPAPASTKLQQGLAVVFRHSAAAIRLRWQRQPDEVAVRNKLDEMQVSLTELHGFYDGNLQRPAGVSSRDRALVELVDIAGRLHTYQGWPVATEVSEADAELQETNAPFAMKIADSLDSVADSLADDGNPPDPGQIIAGRDAHLHAISDWVSTERGKGRGELIQDTLDHAFPLRLTSVSAEMAAASALTAQTGSSAVLDDPNLAPELRTPGRGAIAQLASHVSWDSPWLRNALRSAVALAISVGIAKYLGLGHEFWIVLGTLSALRFDALGTGRTVIQAFLGTAIGVGVGTVLILALGSDTIGWWVLLPISLFFAAYTPGTFGLATGQAGFSMAVLVLFSVLYPADLQTAELRILDVAIGLGVSIIIALVMWPRGVAATLYTRMREAMEAATEHLVASMDYICGGAIDSKRLVAQAQTSSAAIDRAQEAFDLSIAQQPPKSIPIEEWSRLSNGVRQVDFAARIIPVVVPMVADTSHDRPVPAELVGPLLDATANMREHLETTLTMWETAVTEPYNLPNPEDVKDAAVCSATADLRISLNSYLDAASDWTGTGTDPRPALVVWVSDWTALIDYYTVHLRHDISKQKQPIP